LIEKPVAGARRVVMAGQVRVNGQVVINLDQVTKTRKSKWKAVAPYVSRAAERNWPLPGSLQPDRAEWHDLRRRGRFHRRFYGCIACRPGPAKCTLSTWATRNCTEAGVTTNACGGNGTNQCTPR
jgi:hypothetical protein